MARYIDADKLIDKLEELQFDAPVMTPVIKIIDVIELVEDAPTADVAEVKHGEWVIKSETIQLFDDVDEELYVECPFCKRTFYVPFEFEDEKIIAYAKKHYPYCNCGAKMEGGAE